jgi:hypothetical protein
VKHRENIMLRICGIVLLLIPTVVALALIVNGVQEYAVCMQNHAPTEMSLADFLQSPGRPAWVHLTGCEVDRSAVVRGRSISQIGETSAPVFPDASRGNVRVVLVTAGPYSIAGDQSGAVPQTQEIQGLVRSSLSLNSRRWPVIGLDSRLKKAGRWQLAGDYVVIDEGYQPSAVKASSKIGGGVLEIMLVIWAIYSFLDLPVKQDKRHYAASMQLPQSMPRGF